MTPGERQRRENADKAQHWLAGDFKFSAGSGSALDPAVVAQQRSAHGCVVDPYMERNKANFHDEELSRRKWLAGSFRFSGTGPLSKASRALVEPMDPVMERRIKQHTAAHSQGGALTARF